MARAKKVEAEALPETNEREELLRTVLDRIDMSNAEARSRVDALHDAQAPVEEYELLVEEYPAGFADGFKPVSSSRHNQAIAMLRKQMGTDKAQLAIRSGSEVEAYRTSRISWGNANLDEATGGLVRGRLIQVKGAPSHGKTFACLQAAAETLRRRGRVLWIALEPFDSAWARKCGVPVHFFDPAPGSEEEQYNLAHPNGEGFNLVVGKTGNEVLQTVCNAIELNAWDLIIVDSISVAIARVHLENKEVGDSSPGGEAFMINQFVARAQTAWNAVESGVGKVLNRTYACTSCGETFGAKKDHEKCPSLEKGKPKFQENDEVGEPPRSVVIVVNQLRAQGIGSTMPVAPDAGGGMGLAHGKSADVLFQGAVQLKAMVKGDEVVFGIVSTIRCPKNKMGVPHKEGVVELWVRDLDGYSVAGQYNLMTDLVGRTVSFGKDNKKTFPGLAVFKGLIRQSGAWFYLGEGEDAQKFQGLDALQTYLAENPAVLRALRAELSKRIWADL